MWHHYILLFKVSKAWTIHGFTLNTDQIDVVSTKQNLTCLHKCDPAKHSKSSKSCLYCKFPKCKYFFNFQFCQVGFTSMFCGEFQLICISKNCVTEIAKRHNSVK